MFPQMSGVSIQSPFTTISALLLHLLLIHYCRGQSHLIGPSQPLVATVGNDIILPCHLEPAEDVAAMTLEWTRSELDPRFVYVWRAGQDLINMKNPSYSGRTSLFTDELKQGNISLKLSRVKPADQGKYKCYIPSKNTETFIELVVASDAASSAVISSAGIDRDRGGVVLQCESKGWYPEPEVLWLDGEGKLLPAGPTETVRGPDDLYTVSSRVTVEKRHSNSFTCRVQQKIINQTRETHIHVPDDFFKVQSSSSSAITGLAVISAVSIIIILSLLGFVWKIRQNIKTKRGRWDETDEGQENNRSIKNKVEVQFSTEVEREQEQLMTEETLKMEDLNEEKVEKRKNHLKMQRSEQQRREEAEKILKEQLETKTKEAEDKQTELQLLHDENQRRENDLKTLKEKLENKNRELETIREKRSQCSWYQGLIRAELQRKNKEAKQEVETLETKMETKEAEFQTRTTEFGEKEAELKQLQDEIQRMKNNLQTLEREHKFGEKEAELKQQRMKNNLQTLEEEHKVETSRASPARSSFLPWKIISRQKLQEEQQRREDAENQVQTLQKELQTQKEELEKNQTEVQQLQYENQRQHKDLQRMREELEAKNKQLEGNQTEANRKLQQETQRRTEAEREVERLKKENQTEVQQLQYENQRQHKDLQRMREELEAKNKQG